MTLRWMLPPALLFALQAVAASALCAHVDFPELRDFWTPLMADVGLSPNATIQIKMHARAQEGNASVVILTHEQFSRQRLSPSSYSLLGHRRIVLSYWRQVLGEGVVVDLHVHALQPD